MRWLSSRRLFLMKLASFALLPGAARAADQSIESVVPLIRKITRDSAIRPGRVAVDLPLLAENGHSVPLTVTVDSPMTDVDHVRNVYLLSEKNPRPLIARFRLAARAGRAQIITRIRLAGSQRVVAVAEMSDQSFWYGTAEVNVTESACLDGPA